MKYGIHWFRRDLRITGNPALRWNLEKHRGRVLGLFVFDPAFLSRPDIGKNRFAFFLETLEALREELNACGGDLLVIDLGPDRAFPQLLDQLKKSDAGLPDCISFNRDYEPFARQRDERISAVLAKDFGIQAHSERDHLLIEPWELTKNNPGTWYQVYSPFQKKWLQMLATRAIQERISKACERSPEFDLRWEALLGSAALKKADRLGHYLARSRAETDIRLPQAGHRAAIQALKSFEKERLSEYASSRDFPGINGTSHLSVYLKNGSITVAQVIASLQLEHPSQRSRDRSAATQSSTQKFLNELIWREFYYHILYHCPRVEQEAFQEKYRDIAWENDPELFRAWCEGRTGYPIVDAAMRQLNSTGWMHNRMRMVVASFLTKDLLIDWKWGERYFMQKLLDGDLAPNNGGWQWAASTGCDPQPYFRIFNPVLQAKRFDPEGDYVRRFVPELSGLDARLIHEPWKKALPNGYPERIVDHSSRSKKAIALFRRT